MATENTTYLNWDKPVFPSDDLATELDALIDQIDVSMNNVDGGAAWTVSDGGTEIESLPGDLNFGTGISVTDDGDGSVTIEGSNQYTDSDALSAVNNDADHGATAQHDYFPGGHGDLTGIGSGDHHTRYDDTEAVAAVNDETSLSVDITGDADTLDGYHAGSFVQNRYTDTEAVSAVNAESSLSVDISGDADTVDGINIYYQSSEPSSPSDGDIWIAP